VAVEKDVRDGVHGGGTCGSDPCPDVFVAHLDLGNNLLGYSTFLGGTQDDQGLGLAVDNLGNAYVTGFTTSGDFPVMDAIQATKGADGCSAAPCADAFAVQLAASGSELVYATYLGGSGEDFGLSLALDAACSAYVTGYTFSPDFPTTPGAFDTTLEGTTKSDAFILKIGDDAP